MFKKIHEIYETFKLENFIPHLYVQGNCAVLVYTLAKLIAVDSCVTFEKRRDELLLRRRRDLNDEILHYRYSHCEM